METKKIEVRCICAGCGNEHERVEECGEWHEEPKTLNVQHLPSDYPKGCSIAWCGNELEADGYCRLHLRDQYDEAIMAEIADQEFSWGEERVAQE